jgi:hypothetical protein
VTFSLILTDVTCLISSRRLVSRFASPLLISLVASHPAASPRLVPLLTSPPAASPGLVRCSPRLPPPRCARRRSTPAQIARAKEVKSHFLQKTAHEEHDARKAAEKAATGVIVSLGLVKEDEGK